MFTDINAYIREIALMAVPLLLSITFHEVAHGYTAYLLGDPTAKRAGRLTLNPLKHLDPLGVLAFILTRMIGWAKPVPVDMRYFKNPQKGMVLVAIAGPATNFVLAFVCSLLLQLILSNAHAVAPGSTAESIIYPLALMCKYGVIINLALCVFNLLPIPPLDGSNILAGFMPPETAYKYMQLGRYGFIVIILLAVTGALGWIIRPAMQALYSLLV